MSRRGGIQKLSWLFFLAVIVPTILLALIAMRAVTREEAYLEKRLETALASEVTGLVAAVQGELKRIEDELAASAPPPVDKGGKDSEGESLGRWRLAHALVDVPFLLSPEFEILWPREGTDSPEHDLEFLRSNGEFVSNREETPVFENIALAFQEELVGPRGAAWQPSDALKPEAAPQPSDASKPETAAQAQPGAQPQSGEQAQSGAQPAPVARLGELSQPDLVWQTEADSEAREAQAPLRAEKAADTEPRKDLLQSQQALNLFEMDEEARKKAYDQARELGRPVQSRVVSPAGAGDRAKGNPAQSVFISRDLRFDEITQDRQFGLIPRLVGERLTVLFWARRPDGRIVGCTLADAALRERLGGLVGAVYTESRILTLLDERGQPLIAPPEDGPRDYRRPFVARELSELLPRWEAAAYLTDPEAISSRAGLAVVILWALVSILLLSVLGGGTLVLRSLRSELALARQKTTFVANVSHELKTPLTSIRLFAEMLKENRQPDEQRRRHYLSLMVAEAERLTRLINNVLDFSRREQGRKRYEPILLDLQAFGVLCAELVEAQRPRLEAAGFAVALRLPGTTIDGGESAEVPAGVGDPGTATVPESSCGSGDTDLPGRADGSSDLRVRVDGEAFKQALLNLLGNAEKYSGDRKEIEVEVALAGEQVRVDVLDRGIGVMPGQEKLVFKEFFRGDDSLTSRVTGTGLGLPIARGIARDLGGDLLYVRREGGGSIFRILLPLESAAGQGCEHSKARGR